MTSYRFDIGAAAEAASRLYGQVRDEIVRAVVEESAESKETREQLAERLGEKRSEVNNQLVGKSELTIRWLAKLAEALDRDVIFELRRRERRDGENAYAKTATVGGLPVMTVDGSRKDR